MDNTLRCARHPQVETYLRCSRCDVPICSRCLVQTPIGARCPECAALRRLPTYDVSTTQYLKAAGAGVITALILGIGWAFIPLGGIFSILIVAGIGYLLGEVLSRVVNRKRGLGLQIIGGSAVLLAYLSMGTFGRVVELLLVGAEVSANAVLVAALRALIGGALNIWVWIALILGVLVALGRLK